MTDFSGLFSNFVNFCYYYFYYFFPVNNILDLSTLIVFRYLFLSGITFFFFPVGESVENSWNQYYGLHVEGEPLRQLCCATMYGRHNVMVD